MSTYLISLYSRTVERLISEPNIGEYTRNLKRNPMIPAVEKDNAEILCLLLANEETRFFADGGLGERPDHLSLFASAFTPLTLAVDLRRADLVRMFVRRGIRNINQVCSVRGFLVGVRDK